MSVPTPRSLPFSPTRATPDSLSHPAVHFKRLLESHSRRVFPDQPHRFLAQTVEEELLITNSCSVSPTFFPHSGPGASQSLFSGICEWLSPATGVSLCHLPYFPPSVYIPHLLQNPAWRSPLGNLRLAYTTVTDWTCPRFWFPVPLSLAVSEVALLWPEGTTSTLPHLVEAMAP